MIEESGVVLLAHPMGALFSGYCFRVEIYPLIHCKRYRPLQRYFVICKGRTRCCSGDAVAVWPWGGAWPPKREHLGASGMGLGGCGVAIGHHAIEHGMLARSCSGGIAPGIVGPRRADESGEEGSLRKIKVCGRDAKIALSSGINAISSFTKVDEIQIHFENLAFVVVLLDLHGQQQIFEFEWDGVVIVIEVGILGKLGSECATALHDAPGTQIVPGGAHQTNGIYAVVLIEALVFNGNQRLLLKRRNLCEWCVGCVVSGILRTHPGMQPYNRWRGVPGPEQKHNAGEHER